VQWLGTLDVTANLSDLRVRDRVDGDDDDDDQYNTDDQLPDQLEHRHHRLPLSPTYRVSLHTNKLVSTK